MNIPEILGVLVLVLLFKKTQCFDLSIDPLKDDALGESFGLVDSLAKPLIEALAQLRKNGPIDFGEKSDETYYGSTTDKVIESFGYPVEIHDINISDGYILRFYRVPYAKNDNQTKDRPVVLILHGQVCSSFGFVTSYYAEQNLPLLLALAGYDVWLGNWRGTRDSLQHVSLSAKESEYWKFGWDEMALFDLPQSIDYILKKTGQKKLFYIGHSLGSTAVFALLSKMPEYNSKIIKIICLGPIAKFSHQTANLARLYQFFRLFNPLSIGLGVKGKFLPGIDEFSLAMAKLCALDYTHRTICLTIYNELVGLSPKNLNVTQIGLFLSGFPTSTSTRSFIHSAQETKADRFQMFDYGKEENMKRYNQTKPPPYCLKSTTAPVAIFNSASDRLAPPLEVDYIKENLPNVVYQDYLEADVGFSHFDYNASPNATDLVYSKVIEQFKANSEQLSIVTNSNATC